MFTLCVRSFILDLKSGFYKHQCHYSFFSSHRLLDGATIIDRETLLMCSFKEHCLERLRSLWQILERISQHSTRLLLLGPSQHERRDSSLLLICSIYYVCPLIFICAADQIVTIIFADSSCTGELEAPGECWCCLDIGQLPPEVQSG